MKKVLNILLISVLSLYLVGCAGKKADPDYVASLNHAKEMSKETNRSVKTFELVGTDMVILGVTSIITREPLPPVAVQKPTNGYDVLNNMIQPVAKLGGIALGVWGAIEIADTIKDAGETVVVRDQEVVPVNVPGETIVVEHTTATETVQVVNQAGPVQVVDQPFVVEVPTAWEYPPYPDAPAGHPLIPAP